MTDQGASLRAAQAWADLDDQAMAKALGVSVRTLSRLKASSTLSYERRECIASATGVPAWFLESGFEGVTAPEQPALAERIEALENRMDAIYEIALNRVAGDIGLTPRAPAEGSGAERREDRPR